jgi:hypothetical protein
MANSPTSEAIPCTESKKGEVEITMFQASKGVPLGNKRLFPTGDPGGSWVSVTAEFAIEGSGSFKLPGGETDAQKSADDWKTKFCNSMPLTQLAANFDQAKWSSAHFGGDNLKLKIGGVDANGVWTVGEFTFAEWKLTVPNFSAKPKSVDVLNIPITCTMVSINPKSQAAQIFPVVAAIEIPLVAFDLPPSAVFSGALKLVGKLSVGVNAVKLAEEMGIKVAEDAGEEMAGALAIDAAAFAVAVVVSISIVIVLEKLLYGANDDFDALNSRAGKACDAFAAAFAAGLKGAAQPSAEEAVTGPNSDGFKAGTDVRSKTLDKWRSTPPSDVKKKMTDDNLSLEDAVKALGFPDATVNDIAAKARASYLPKARLVIATQFVQSHGDRGPLVAAAIENWWIKPNTSGSNEFNQSVTPVGWQNVPDGLKSAYKDLDQPKVRMRIQGVDPAP